LSEYSPTYISSLRQLVAGLSLRSPGFSLTSVRVTWWWISGKGTGFSLSTSVLPYQYRSTNAALSILLLSEGPAGKSWEPSNMVLGEKYFHIILFPERVKNTVATSSTDTRKECYFKLTKKSEFLTSHL
jgi:hypothetical protein